MQERRRGKEVGEMAFDVSKKRISGGAGKDGWIEGGWTASAQAFVSLTIDVMSVSDLAEADSWWMCSIVQQARGRTSEYML